MQRLVSCKICSLAIAKYSCRKCGATVCESCYDKGLGLCLSCKQGRGAKHEIRGLS